MVTRFKNSKTLKAIGLMLLAVFFISVMNACAKLSSEDVSVVEIVFYRGIVGLIALSCWLLYSRRFDLLKTKRPLAHLGRSGIGTIGVYFVYWAYALMPMGEASTLLLTSSVFVTVLSIPILGEKVGGWRWAAVFIGFLGAGLVGNPAAENFNLTAFAVGMTAACTISLVYIFLSKLGRTESSFTTVFYFCLANTTISGLYVLWQGDLPPLHAIWPLIGTGIASLSSLLLKSEAFKHGEASMLSPIDYMNLFWAVIFGFMIWGDVPSWTMMAGAGLIIGSNILIIWREHVHKQKHLESPLVN